MSVIEREIIAYISPEKKKKGSYKPISGLESPPPPPLYIHHQCGYLYWLPHLMSGQLWHVILIRPSWVCDNITLKQQQRDLRKFKQTKSLFKIEVHFFVPSFSLVSLREYVMGVHETLAHIGDARKLKTTWLKNNNNNNNIKQTNNNNIIKKQRK